MIRAIEICNSCKGERWNKPKLDCADPAHKQRWEKILAKEYAYKKQMRQKAVEILGGRCVKCGNTDIRVLQINHKNGGGRQDRKGRPYRFYREIVNGKRDREGYDVRCANCNILYQYEIGKLHHL